MLPVFAGPCGKWLWFYMQFLSCWNSSLTRKWIILCGTAWREEKESLHWIRLIEHSRRYLNEWQLSLYPDCSASSLLSPQDSSCSAFVSYASPYTGHGVKTGRYTHYFFSAKNPIIRLFLKNLCVPQYGTSMTFLSLPGLGPLCSSSDLLFEPGVWKRWGSVVQDDASFAGTGQDSGANPG